MPVFGVNWAFNLLFLETDYNVTNTLYCQHKNLQEISFKNVTFYINKKCPEAGMVRGFVNSANGNSLYKLQESNRYVTSVMFGFVALNLDLTGWNL